MKNKKKKNIKINKKYLIIFIIAVLLLLGIFLLFKGPNVGKIKNGKVEYIDRIENVTYYKKKDMVLIEFKNNQELIDNCVMTSELYKEFKDSKSTYNKLNVKEYSRLRDISDKERYNLNKALQLKLVKESTSYTEYFAMTCGFKNKKQLMKYTDKVIKLEHKVN